MRERKNMKLLYRSGEKGEPKGEGVVLHCEKKKKAKLNREPRIGSRTSKKTGGEMELQKWLGFKFCRGPDRGD